MRIAVLEDDPSQAELLSHWLRLAGHHPFAFDQGGALLRALERERFDALMLDWNVPDLSGLKVLEWVRQRQQLSIPVVFVTMRDREEDIVAALRAGADDYVVKPVRRLELLARLDAVLRRGRHEEAQPKVIESGAVRLDCQTRTAALDSRRVDLTRKDFDLSVLFLSNIGRLLSRSYIRDTVWGSETVVTSRTLDTHVSRVRNKLGFTPEHGWQLTAVYGHGYRLEQLHTAARSAHRRGSH
jgi:DNA-binding response OmpR family regulator